MVIDVSLKSTQNVCAFNSGFALHIYVFLLQGKTNIEFINMLKKMFLVSSTEAGGRPLRDFYPHLKFGPKTMEKLA